MDFAQHFMKSTEVNNESNLFLVKLLAEINNVHMEENIMAKGRSFTIHAMSILKTNKFKDLKIVIRTSRDADNVRLAEVNDGYAIVIDVDEDAKKHQFRDIIDNKTVADLIKKQFVKYFSMYHKPNVGDNKHHLELEHEFNNPEKIEELYDELYDAISLKFHNQKKAIGSLKTQKTSFSRSLTTGATDIAIQKLMNELGDTPKKFISIVLKMPEADFFNYLDDKNKKMIKDRIEDLYYLNKEK